VGDHPSGTHVAVRLMRPEPGSLGRATLKHSPIWPCTGRGLPSRPVTRTAGELLPHRFTLTRTPRKGPLAVCSLLRFPSGFPGWPLTSALLCGVRTFLDGRLAGFEKLRDAAPPRPPGLPKKCTTGVRSSDVRSDEKGRPVRQDRRQGSAHDEDEDGDDAGEAADPCQSPDPGVALVPRSFVGVGHHRGRKSRIPIKAPDGGRLRFWRLPERPCWIGVGGSGLAHRDSLIGRAALRHVTARARARWIRIPRTSKPVRRVSPPGLLMLRK
jgi:hypothetical protein